MSDFATLPLVSIITPSFNQAKYINETILSVLNQDYPSVEHIVVDGGSNDGTLEILNRYRDLGGSFRFISERDNGQSHALNKGLKMARGEIIGWLNSDDTYLPGAIKKAVYSLEQNPGWGMVYGNAYYTDSHNKVIKPYPVQSFTPNRLFNSCIICQPAVFIRKPVFEELKGVDEHLHFCMDYDLWIRMSKKFTLGHVDDFFSNYRLHPQSKTTKYSKTESLFEIFKTSFKHYGTISNLWIFALIQNHYTKGEDWIIEFLKRYSVFGNTPKISANDKLENSPVVFSIMVDPRFPLDHLVIRGKQKSQKQLLLVKHEELIQTFSVKKRSFTLDIPLQSIEPNTIVNLIPISRNENSKTNYQAIPLSKEEYDFYKALRKGPKVAKKWLEKKRRHIPSLS